MEAGAQNSGMLPASFLEEMRKDAQLAESLAPIQFAADQLQKQIDDTVMQVGGEVLLQRASFRLSARPRLQRRGYELHPTISGSDSGANSGLLRPLNFHRPLRPHQPRQLPHEARPFNSHEAGPTLV